MNAYHVWVTGIVQGVWYRQSTQNQALTLSVSGWVRNLADGRVEAFIQGPEADLQSLLSWMRQGPPNAEVQEVSFESATPDSRFQSFKILRD